MALSRRVFPDYLPQNKARSGSKPFCKSLKHESSTLCVQCITYKLFLIWSENRCSSWIRDCICSCTLEPTFSGRLSNVIPLSEKPNQIHALHKQSTKEVSLIHQKNFQWFFQIQKTRVKEAVCVARRHFNTWAGRTGNKASDVLIRGLPLYLRVMAAPKSW